jgi:arabinose-5-phosphate isomerase
MPTDDSVINSARATFDLEIEGLIKTRDSLGDGFKTVVDAIDKCEGHVLFMGIGKSGHICRKIVATMQSLGIKSFFLHPAEALHGDLGCIDSKDIIIAVSNSGETVELLNTLPSIERIGAKLYCVVSRDESTLGKRSVASIVMPKMDEAFLDGMIPTTSTTATLVIGDALAICVANRRGFTKDSFGIFHPHGTLGKRMTLKISEIMIPHSESDIVTPSSTVRQAIFAMCSNPMGGVNITDNLGKLVGVFTDGDLRRLMSCGETEVMNTTMDTVMTHSPMFILDTELVYDVICNTVREKTVSFYPVVDADGKCLGAVRMLDFVRSGLM